MKRKYQVAIILINYNSGDYTLDCVNSIRAQTAGSLSYQIVIVDNNSTREEYGKIELLTKHAEIKLFRSRINVGFSGANMMGVQLADADYYYFLNNDCVLLNDCVSILHRFLENNQSVANASGEMINAEGKYECGFGYFPTISLKFWGSGILKIFSPEKFPSRSQQIETPIPVDVVSGSAMFIRAAPFETIGGFDTNYFLYCEEEDIALRLRRAGHQTFVVPQAKYQHFANKSTKSDNAIKLPFLKEYYISFFYYYRKNYNSFYWRTIQILSFLKAIRKFYRNRGYVELAIFIAKGAPVKQSLRFTQKINPEPA
jgi:GT2 family glycosyltransferase